MEEGLPANAVLALAPARDGYLWVGGLNGLVRFDGVRFVHFHTWDGLTSLQIGHLLEDRAGRLWIGTEDAGVIMREGGVFHAFGRTNGLGGERVRALAEDAEGRIWVAHEAGVARWDGGRFVDMALPQPKNWVAGCTSVICESNSVWAVRNDWVLLERRDGRWRSGPQLPPKSGFRFEQIFRTRDGALWSQLSPFGLARLTAKQWRIFGAESGLPKSYINCVLDQGESGLLCGTFEQGLFLFRDERASPAGMNEPPEMDGVLSLQRDNLGNLWVGTRSKGLLRLRNARVQVVPGSERARIARMAFDTRGRLWISSGQELWFEQQGRLVTVAPPAAAQKFPVIMLKPCAAGGVWLSVAGSGLWQYDPDRNDRPVHKYKTEEGDSEPLVLANDRASGLWFATVSGTVGHLTEEGTNIFRPFERAARKRIGGLTACPSGGVWVQVEGTGFLRLDEQGQVQEQIGAREGLAVNAIRCWLDDGEGGVWIGTPMGLLWWRNSRLLVFDSRHGLPGEAISNLVEDRSGHLWCAANNRLFRLTKRELADFAASKTQVVHPLVIGRSDGLKPNPFASGFYSPAIRGPNGRLFVPRIHDVVSFDPAEFEQPAPAPRVIIEEALADGRQLELPNSMDTPLRIQPRTGEFLLRYTALQCAAPETLRFRYRLEGLDEPWTEAVDQRAASFRRLPPGTYHFRVTASASGGAWAEPGASLAFIILPAWYQTPWFRVLAELVVVGGAAGFYWRRISRLEAQRTAQQNFSRRLIQSQEQERKRIAGELHDSLGQNLLVIKNRADIALKASTSSAPEQFNEISRVAAQALAEVREISQNLRPYQLDRLGFTRAVSGLIKQVSASSALKIAAEIAPLDRVFPPEAEINLYRIVQEGLNNILKHSGATEARITLQQDGARVRLVIQDNGRGFDFPAATQNPARASGMGLDGIAERVRILGGKLDLQSRPGSGTQMKIELPLRAGPTPDT